MRHVGVALLLLQLSAWAGAADIVYMTDLSIYSSLAPCAATVVSNQIQILTESTCPQGVTALESCACSKNNNAAAVASAIGSSVLNYCGSTATEDVASASSVFSRYCNQGGPGPTITPVPTLVSQYISDLAAYSNLAPCAASGLSNAVFTLTNAFCPTGQSALESCACTKNQNSLAASERINSNVFYYCGSTHTEDVTSAQAIFAGYCGMGAGTTSFPAPGSISGTITYYITDLPSYSGLAPCAASAVSQVVQGLTETYCPSAPSAIASCACFKDQNSAAVSSSVVSYVKYSCSSTASADVTSALSLLDFYCSAAKGAVVASGVTASVAVSQATGGSAATSGGQSPKPNATPTSPGASATAAAGSSSGSSSGSGVSSNSPGASSNGALIGGVVGGVGAVALIGIGLAVWLCRRKRHQPAPIPPAAGTSPNQEKTDVELHQYTKMSTPPLNPQGGFHEVPGAQGISEMPNQTAQGKYTAPSQYTKMSSPSMHAVSPIYEGGSRPNVPEMAGQGQPYVPEMAGQGQPYVPEMAGQRQHYVPEMGGQPAVPEMPNNNGRYQPPRQSNYSGRVYEMGQQQPYATTSHNNAGPVYEMYSPDPR